MTEPLVSILIPLYNAERFIADTVARCLAQSYADIEIIIVDDHSTDRSLARARALESDRVHVYENPLKGGNSARNHAFRMSRGEYVKFLDADDYCSPRMTERQLQRLLADGTSDSVVFSPVRMYYANEDRWLQPPHSIEHDYTPAIELLLDIWRGKGWRCPHCHMMHRSLVEKAGLWDETVLKNQDGEFFARIYAAADKALSVPDEYAVWTQQADGVHTKKSLAAVESAATTLGLIARLILDYRDDMETRRICNRYFGGFLYENYADNPDMWPQFKALADALGLRPTLPRRRILRLLRMVMGWRLALRMLKKINV